MLEIVSWDVAARALPLEAANIERLTGKKRSRCRRNLREKVTFENAQAAGCSCKNCVFFTAKDHIGRTNVCEWDSDFHGTAYTKPDSLCLAWIALQEQAK
jgi:hypothetical protein